MELSEIFLKLKEIDKVIDPSDCNLLSSYLSGFLIDSEEELAELNLQVSNRWLNMRGEMKTNTMVDRAIEIEPIFLKREAVKLKIMQMKRLRGDLKDRVTVLTMINKRY